MSRLKVVVAAAALVVVIGWCALPRVLPCDPRLRVPDGFCASVFAEDVGPARHLVVRENGDVYVATWQEGRRPGGVVALRDTNHDGVADERAAFGPEGGSGIALAGDKLYFATWTNIVRYTLEPGRLAPSAEAETVVTGMPALDHGARSIALSGTRLFLNIGVPSNACERSHLRPRDLTGDYPCRELLNSGGIWRFDIAGDRQRPTLENRFATGLRHSVALAVNPIDGRLYAAPHGIDHLDRWWPESGYSERDAAAIPSEALFRIDSAGDYGFPYCMHDPRTRRMIVAPAYAAAPVAERCARSPLPIATFAAHSAPMALAWKVGQDWGAEYSGATFVALHGSLFHSPEKPRGYSVMYIPARAGAGPAEFVSGRSMLGRTASARPSGLAFGPDGTLFISDDMGRRVWAVRRRSSR